VGKKVKGGGVGRCKKRKAPVAENLAFGGAQSFHKIQRKGKNREEYKASRKGAQA